MNKGKDQYEWTFPCTLPIKVMGPSRESLKPLTVEIVQKHVPDFRAENIRETESRTGKYISLTIHVEFENKPQIDALFAEFSWHQQNGDDISFVI